MSDRSGIEWTDATWSPVVGCTRVSPGCDNCYAVGLTRRLEALGQEKYSGLVNPGKEHFNGVARLHAPHLDVPLRWKRPRRIFVNPMSDLFHEALSFEAIAAVFGVMAAAPRHTFQVLTKRPERAVAFFEWVKTRPDQVVGGCVPPREQCAWQASYLLSHEAIDMQVTFGSRLPWPLGNLWLGYSAENQERLDCGVPLLLRCPAAVRFISYEPALGPVNLTRVIYERVCVIDALRGLHGWPVPHADCARLDWVIAGGESGTRARAVDLAWIRSVVAECREAGVPVFVKQLGSHPEIRPRCGGDPVPLELQHSKGGDIDEWPADLQIREFPTTKQQQEAA